MVLKGLVGIRVVRMASFLSWGNRCKGLEVSGCRESTPVALDRVLNKVQDLVFCDLWEGRDRLYPVNS